MNENIPVQSVTYQVTYSSHPVTADEINIQSGENVKKTVTIMEQDVALNFFDGIIANKNSAFLENGILKTGITPCNGACNSGAPDLEDLQADQQFGIHQTVGVDSYSAPPAYNPWYKPCAKRGQQLHSPTIDEVTNFLATYRNQPRPRNSWLAGECLGILIGIVIFVAILSYTLMRIGGHFDASYGPIR